MGGQVTTEVLVCEGRPAEVIVETAKRLHADTIVMRTHGSRGWLKWLHRNTALKVMRQATCTIRLVFREVSEHELFRPLCLISAIKTRGEPDKLNRNLLVYSN